MVVSRKGIGISITSGVSLNLLWANFFWFSFCCWAQSARQNFLYRRRLFMLTWPPWKLNLISLGGFSYLVLGCGGCLFCWEWPLRPFLLCFSEMSVDPPSW